MYQLDLLTVTEARLHNQRPIMDLNGKTDEQKRPVKTLPSGWEARLGLNGRVYYYSRHSHTVQVLPPPESWSCIYGVSYGWEVALDYEDKPYYINHIQQQVSYDDPRVVEQMTNGDTDTGSSGVHEPPVPREYVIPRQGKIGFGFVAGSEKPVVIRTVTPGGPSDNILQPEDQIIKIGDENVRNMPRERVIKLIRESTDTISMTVLQPERVANSSFLKPGKKLMKGSNRPRVRFAEDNFVNGEERAISGSELLVVPGVLKVYLEESQSRSFQFNPDTTAGDIVSALCEKLDIKDSKLYSLVLTPSKPKNPFSQERTKFSCSDEILIPPWDHVAKILSNSSVKHHECRFRLTFVAKDIHKMSREDPRSFRYHYQQCVNDVVSGMCLHWLVWVASDAGNVSPFLLRALSCNLILWTNKGLVYADDLSTDDILRLASLQMLELSLVHLDGSAGSIQSETLSRRVSKKKAFLVPSKISLKQIEKDFGLERFLPPPMVHLASSSHSKEHRKTLQQYLKANFATYVSSLNGNSKSSSSPPVSPTHPPSSALEGMVLQLRMQYIKVLSPLHLYGGRYFEATILAVVESDVTLIVGHHYGISQLINSKTKMASVIADFSLVESVEVASYSQEASKTKVRVDFKDKPPLVVAMQPQLALNFAYMISGYCQVHNNEDIMLTMPVTETNSAPEYFGSHKVKVSHWNYPPDADPSSSFYCDFSEPISFSLLSDHIPDSVRFMYEHSKILDEDQDKAEKSSAENSDELDGELASPIKTNTPIDDEGVALTGEVSPNSSVSSMASASPSSGIGSVTSRSESHPTGRQLIVSEGSLPPEKPDDESEWNELIVALNSDDDLGFHSSKSLNAKKRVDNDTDNKKAASVSQAPFNGLDLNDEKVLIEPVVAVISNKEIELKSEELKEVKTSSNTEAVFVSSKDGAVTKTETKKEEKEQLPSQVKVDTKSPPVVFLPAEMSNRRFSSFKPKLAAESTADQYEPSASTPIGTILEEESTISTNQLKLQLETNTTSNDVPISDEHDYPEELLTSPLPVDDLARGHKSLKSNSSKKRHRISWFKGGSHSMSRSFSLDKELNQSNDKAKSKSLLRNFFSPKRSYSTGKEPGLFKLRSSDAMFGPEPGFNGKQKFTSSVSFSPQSRKRSKFSFLKSFGRKKRSHTLHSPDQIGSPVLIQPISGVYSVFEPNEIDKNDADKKKTSIPLATSMEDVRLRFHDKISPKPRPVSFMTFQQLPGDFTVHQSPKENDRSPRWIRSPQLPLSRLVRSVVEDSTDSESVLSSQSSVEEEIKQKKRTPSVEVPFASFLKADLEEHFAKQKALEEAKVTAPSTTAPVKPARNIGSIKKANKTNTGKSPTNNMNISHRPRNSTKIPGKVKRHAPPPPVVSPKPTGRNRIDATTDGNEDVKKMKNVCKDHDKTGTISQETENNRVSKTEKAGVVGAATTVVNSIDNPSYEMHIIKDVEARLPTKTSNSIEAPGPNNSVNLSTDNRQPHKDVALQNKTSTIEVSETVVRKSKSDVESRNIANLIASLQDPEPATNEDDTALHESSPHFNPRSYDDSISSSEEPSDFDDISLVGEVLAALDKSHEEQKVDSRSFESEINKAEVSRLPAAELKVDDVVHEVSHQSPTSYKNSPTNSYGSFATNEDEIKHVESERTEVPVSAQGEPSLVAHALNNLLLNGFDSNSKLVDAAKKSSPLKERTTGFVKVGDPLPSAIAEEVDDVDKTVIAIENNNESIERQNNIKNMNENNEKLTIPFLNGHEDISSNANKQVFENHSALSFPAEEYSDEQTVTIDTSPIESRSPSREVPGELPLFLPPPEEFNVPLSPPQTTPTQTIDLKRIDLSSGNEVSPALPSQNSSEAEVVIRKHEPPFSFDRTEPVIGKSADTGDYSEATPRETSDQLNLSLPSNSKPDKPSLTSPTSHLYHALIAPRVFGQKSDTKKFTRFSAPTDKAKAMNNSSVTDNSAHFLNGNALESEQSSRWSPPRKHTVLNHVPFSVSSPRSAQSIAAPKSFC